MPRLAVAIALVFLLGACRPASDNAPSSSSPESTNVGALADTAIVPGAATITGEVFYLPRIALPPEAEVSVTLQDVSAADAPAVEIASTTFRTEGRQVPLPFSLAYEPAKIDASRRYSMMARISNAGELLWISDAHTAALTQGAPADSFRIKVSQVPK